jgi:hypothetical protein
MYAKKAVITIMHLIDWQLKNNQEVVLDLKNVRCSFNENILTLNEEDAVNKIDLNTKKYNRKSLDYTMEIDFNSQVCSFAFANNEKCAFDIECELINKENEIILTYKYDEEVKEINIKIGRKINEK